MQDAPATGLAVAPFYPYVRRVTAENLEGRGGPDLAFVQASMLRHSDYLASGSRRPAGKGTD